MCYKRYICFGNNNNNSNDETLDMKCNCRVKPECPLNGKCKYNNTVYEATVTAEDRSIRNYIGMTEHNFKTRCADHKQSFEKKKYATKTSLSRYLWKLKKAGKKHSIKWSIYAASPCLPRLFKAM